MVYSSGLGMALFVVAPLTLSSRGCRSGMIAGMEGLEEIPARPLSDTDSERFRNSYGIFPSGTSTTQYGFWELEEHPASFWMLRKWTESV